MDDALAVQNAHGSCDLMQKHSDGVLAECALSWEKRCSTNT